MKIIVAYFITMFVGFETACSQSDTLAGLQTEVYLHPLDAFTAYTLKKREFVYNQSPFTLPFPSWAWVGITDNITAEIDLLPLIGGLFQKPYLPQPSFNFRIKVIYQSKWIPEIAFEIMYQHLWTEITQLDLTNATVRRKGNSLYNHFNFSWKILRKMYIHFSSGLMYVENLYFSNNDSLNLIDRFYSDLFTPDFSVSIDYRWKPWISLHASASYGATFVYLDNIPRKYQIAYGFRIAPFYENKHSFLRYLRAEFAGLYIYLPDIDESIKIIPPLFPYFYWQFSF